MPPKAGKEKASDDDDEVLQAVILADSFNSRFSPFTADKPRVGAFFRTRKKWEFSVERALLMATLLDIVSSAFV